MFAEEMYRRQVQRGSAGGASTRLKYCRAAAECSKFVAFGLGFSSVGLCEAAVLEGFLMSTNETTNEVERMKRGPKADEVKEKKRKDVRWRFLFFPALWCR